MTQLKADGSEGLIGVYGRSLRPHEKKYHITELELLALLIGIERYKYLIVGRRLHIRTDSKMVEFLKSIKTKPSHRHTRWLIELSPILDSDLTTIEHIKGSSNIPSDFLSRQEYRDQDIPDSEKDLIDSDLIVLLSEFYEDSETFEKIHFDPENIFPPELDRTIANRLREEEKQTSIRPDDYVQFRPRLIDDQKNEPKDELNYTDLYLSFKRLANNKPTEFNCMLERQNDVSNDHSNLDSKQKFQRVSANEEWLAFSNNNDTAFDFTEDDDKK